MSDNKKNTRKEWKDFLRYTSNNMSGSEKNAFEKDLQKDPFTEEAMEGLSSVKEADFLADMEDLNSRVNKRLTEVKDPNRKILFYRIAASIAVLVILSSVFYTYFLGRTNKLSSETAITALPEIPEGTAPATEFPSGGSATTDPLQYPEPEESTVPPPAPDLKKREVIVPEYQAEKPVIAESEVTPAGGEDLHSIDLTEKAAEIISPEIVSEIPAAALVAIEQDNLRPVRSKDTFAGARIAAMASEQLYDSDKKATHTRHITGTVISGEDLTPIPGASILIRGTSLGTISGSDGSFKLDVPGGRDTLVTASFIGMETAEVPVQTDEELKIILQPSDLALNEVVVIGYGTQKRSEATGSVSVVKMNEDPQTDHTLPSPVTGQLAFNQYIKEHQAFPEGTSLKRAIVVLNFTVGLDGKPRDINIVKSPDEAFSQEAIRLVKNGPSWHPGKRGDVPFEDNVRLRIVLTKRH